MILKVAEKEMFFPEVPLDGDALGAAIYRAIAIVQGPQGANRVLSLKNYSEIVKLASNYASLSIYPVNEITSVFANRELGKDNWGRPIGQSDWVELTPDQYQFEPELNRILVTAPAVYSRIRVAFVSGFVFDETPPDPLTDEAVLIKHQTAAVLEYQQSAQGLGIRELRSSDLTFQDAPPGKVPDELLMPFYRYRPRR